MVNPRPETLVFVPVADAYVNSSSPSKSYGSLSVLRADGSPVLRSYLRFNIQGVSGTVIAAELRVFVETSQAVGHDVHVSPNNAWQETTLTYENAPAFGDSLGFSGPLLAGTYSSVPVTGQVPRNGEVTFVLTTSSTSAVRYSSRENLATPPILVVTFDDSTG